MNRILLTLAFTPLVAYGQFGALQNPGFEQWSNHTLYTLPDNWGTDVEPNSGSLHMSSDAYSGNHSVRLETYVNSGFDTVAASVFLGSVASGIAGIPYSDPFDGIGGYYKCDIEPGDTAVVVVAKWSGGVMSMDVHPFYGQQSDWTLFQFPVTGGSADSVFVGFSSGNPVASRAKMGSWLMVDSVHPLHTGGSLPSMWPNHDFEIWSPVDIEDPDHWSTINAGFYTAGLMPAVVKSTDAHSGNFAAELVTRDFNGTEFPGFLSLAPFDLSDFDFLPYTPYSAQPSSLDGYYKYSGSGNDSGAVYVSFKVGGFELPFFQMLPPASGYTAFSVPITLGGPPDSVAVVFFSGEEVGSTLLLDDVQFAGGDISVEEESATGWKLYPNPVVDGQLYVEIGRDLNDARLEVFDVAGKTLIDKQVDFRAGEPYLLELSFTHGGNYIFRVTGEGEQFTGKVSVR